MKLKTSFLFVQPTSSCVARTLENRSTDVLKVEVWDYDMEENLAQRIGKVSDIKDLKGITRYMKEVAKGKSHDTLGHVQVHLKVSGARRATEVV